MQRLAGLVAIGGVIVMVLSAFALAQPEVNLASEKLFTPPLYGDYFFCNVANVSTMPVIVAATIVDYNGNTLAADTDTCKAGPLQPRHACAVVVTSPNMLAYCRIALLGNKDNVRGALTAWGRRSDFSLGDSAVVEAR